MHAKEVFFSRIIRQSGVKPVSGRQFHAHCANGSSTKPWISDFGYPRPLQPHSANHSELQKQTCGSTCIKLFLITGILHCWGRSFRRTWTNSVLIPRFENILHCVRGENSRKAYVSANISYEEGSAYTMMSYRVLFFRSQTQQDHNWYWQTWQGMKDRRFFLVEWTNSKVVSYCTYYW